MIFVDSSAWLAVAISSDSNHSAAADWLRENRQRLVTIDYVIDEVLTVLRSRGETERALRVGEDFFAGNSCHIEWVTTADVNQAWRFFRDFSDKPWSFTDCVCRAVMERLEIDTAFTFDRHFSQFGTINVVPSPT